jgi:hypothetical protein
LVEKAAADGNAWMSHQPSLADDGAGLFVPQLALRFKWKLQQATQEQFDSARSSIDSARATADAAEGAALQADGGAPRSDDGVVHLTGTVRPALHIMVGVDGSKGAQLAFESAVSLRSKGDFVTCLHITPSTPAEGAAKQGFDYEPGSIKESYENALCAQVPKGARRPRAARVLLLRCPRAAPARRPRACRPVRCGDRHQERRPDHQRRLLQARERAVGRHGHEKGSKDARRLQQMLDRPIDC